MNKVIMIGNLTRDPEHGTTQSDVAYCRFSIAVNRKFSKDEKAGADYFNVTVWRTLADNCVKFLKKGKKVCVVGSIQTSQYVGKDGIMRTSCDIIADDVEFLSPSDAKSDSAEAQGETPATDSSSNENLTPVDEDIPF